MRSDSLFAAFGAVPSFILFLFYLIASTCVYLALIVQISARGGRQSNTGPKTFGLPEAILAVALVLYLLLAISASVSHPTVHLNNRDLVANLIFTVVVVVIIVAFLQLRGFNLSASAGFFSISFRRAVLTGILLILAAYPLIAVAEAITQSLFGSGSSKQNIVELFSGSLTIEQRIMIIIFAVAVAPVVEEFLFRFFLYGVLKRYFGRLIGIFANALLFAAAHTHFPSFVPLFVLGACFTLAYEWSGSILVAMTMHSLFNTVSLVVLAFPELFPQ